MPFCPKCKYEYRVDVNVCPDCNEMLVSAPPAAGPSAGPAAITPDDSWVSVASVQTELIAEMARGALESNNIPSVIVSSSFGAYGSGGDASAMLQGVGGGSRLVMVPREFKPEAEMILKAVLGGNSSADNRPIDG